MKTKNNLILAAVTVLAATMIAPCTAGATIVNVDFNGNNGSQAAAITYVGVGPVGSGTVFNGIAVTDAVAPLSASSLLDMDGLATGIGLSFASVNGSNYNDPNQGGAHVLGDDAFFTNAGTTNFSLSGLTGSTADLYFYGRLDGVLFPDIVITGASSAPFTPTGVYDNGAPPSWVLYFPNVSVTAGSINGVVNSQSIIGGMTIMTAVPEPSAFALLSLGSVFLIAVVRRRARLTS